MRPLALLLLAALVCPALAKAPAASRGADYSPMRATGPRDVNALGDSPNAWAASTADAGPEWLRLQYAEPLPVSEIRVWQNDAPGAIAWITVEVDGQEVEVWKGTDEVPASPTAPVSKVVTLSKPLLTDTVTVYLDTRRATGWNEIDAVEIVAADGRRAWATRAKASTTYAAPKPDPVSTMVGRSVIIRVDGERLGGKLVGGDAEWLAITNGERKILIKRERISWIEVAQ